MLRLAAALLAFLAAALVPLDAAAQAADYVLHNARIYTVDDAQPEAEALAVRGERILMVGTSEAVQGAYPDAPQIDAEGRTVVPGLIDAHAHLMGLGESLLAADLVGTTSAQDVVDRLEAFVRERELPAGAWLTGRGWDQNDWGDGQQGFPTRDDLDAAFPDRPVWLTRIDGHAAWANTAAIDAALGMETLAQMDDPEGGAIRRDAEGTPTGIFIDNAMGLVGEAVPPPSEADLTRGLELALEETARYGLTGVHEAGIGLAAINRYQRFIEEGKMDVRVYAMIGGRGSTFDYVCENGFVEAEGYLTVRAVKFYIDGALGSRGAAMLADYSDDPGNVGLLFQQPSAFTDDVRAAMTCGLQVNTHAIGDRGNRVVLDAYEAAMEDLGRTAGRHRVEHAQILAPEDIGRFAELGVIASVQPTHATSDMPWAEDRVGARRIQGAYAWRSLLDGGARLALGSDFPVERVDPLLGFYAAVTRQDADGRPEGGWLPDEQLTRAEALRGFTLDAAYAAFQDDRLGSITPGKLADFVVLSQDLMEVPTDAILDTEVVATYVGGRLVYAADGWGE